MSRPLRTATARWAMVALLLCPVLSDAAAQQDPGLTLRPGDLLMVEIWREEDLSGEFQVDRDGRVTLPLVGEVAVSGIPWEEVRDRLLERYRDQLRNPSIILTPFRRVYVLGEVTEPGLYEVDPTVSLAGAVALAGGAGPEGDLNRIRVVREGEVILEEVPVESALARVDVRSGDQIFVGRRSWFERNTSFLITAGLSLTGIVISIVTR